ncbi:hypothetical protein [Streptomyces sp. NPDC101145]|uniref:hypothetical protein n=1 Tax=Streptomyces sp. NPDC101145 TaxID=3366112 RepID=UPI0037FD8956
MALTPFPETHRPLIREGSGRRRKPVDEAALAAATWAEPRDEDWDRATGGRHRKPHRDDPAPPGTISMKELRVRRAVREAGGMRRPPDEESRPTTRPAVAGRPEEEPALPEPVSLCARRARRAARRAPPTA